MEDTYTQLATKLNLLRKNAKNLAVQFGTNSKEFKKAAKEVYKLDAKLKKIDNELGRYSNTCYNGRY